MMVDFNVLARWYVLSMAAFGLLCAGIAIGLWELIPWLYAHITIHFG